MNEVKRKRLEEKGWQVGSVDEFLRLTPEEAAYVELKLALSTLVRDLRQQKRLSQSEAAKMLRSSQSRVAKMEAGDSSVSLDLLVRTSLALGASRQDLARVIAAAG